MLRHFARECQVLGQPVEKLARRTADLDQAVLLSLLKCERYGPGMREPPAQIAQNFSVNWRPSQVAAKQVECYGACGVKICARSN